MTSSMQQRRTLPSVLASGIYRRTSRISQHFYDSVLRGREDEYLALLEAYNRAVSSSGEPELIVITAPSGVGKSFFVGKSLQNINPSESGYFVAGKCNDVQRNQPLSSFLDAMILLCDEIISKADDKDKAKIKDKFMEMAQDDGRVLIDLLPNVKGVIGEEHSETVELSDIKARETRLNRVFRSFIHAVVSTAPLVIFIDDIQWVDEATLHLVQYLLNDKQLTGFLVINAYRNNDIDEFQQVLINEHISKLSVEDNVQITEIEMKLLLKETMLNIIADLLCMSCNEVEPIVQYIYERSRGNAQHAIRLLAYLQLKELLRFSSISTKWEWDMNLIACSDIPSTLEEILADELLQMPVETRDLLARAASIGFYFDNYTIQCVMRNCYVDDSLGKVPSFKMQDFIVSSLEFSKERGFLLKVGAFGHQFCHDELWRASYNMLTCEARDRLHLEIGQTLLKNMQKSIKRENSNRQENSDQQELRRRRSSIKIGFSRVDLDSFAQRHLFLIVHQLNKGRRFIEDKVELSNLVSLNIRAATLAMKSSATKQAMVYITTAKELLVGNHWVEMYESSLEVYNTLINAEHSLGNFESAEAIICDVLENAKSLQDKFTAHFTLLHCMAKKGARDYGAAVQCGIKILHMYGFRLPVKPTKTDLLLEKAKSKILLKNRSVSFIASLPETADDSIFELLYLLSLFCLFSGNDAMTALIAQKAVNHAMLHGVSKFFPRIILFWIPSLLMQGRFTTACKYGNLAASISERFREGQHVYVEDQVCLQMLILPLFQPLRQGLDPLFEHHKELMKYGDKVVMKYGDNELGAGAAMTYSIYYIASGLPLNCLLDKRLRLFEAKCKNFPSHSLTFQLYRQFILNLQGISPHKTVLKGEAFDEEKILESLDGNARKMALRDSSVCRLQLAFIFWDKECMEKMLDILTAYPQKDAIVARLFLRLGFVGLSALSLGKETNNKTYLKLGYASMDYFKKLSKAGSLDARAMYLFLKAIAEPGYHAYDKAIAECSALSLVHLEALANERCGVFLKKKGYHEISVRYMTKAFCLYRDWGATAKVNQMREQYDFLQNVEILSDVGKTTSLKDKMN